MFNGFIRSQTIEKVKILFKIGYRTIKTAVGTSVAIAIAALVGLENYSSAGILAILCIQVTKKRSIKASWDRFLACIIGMLFSYLFFEGIAFHPLVIGVLLLFFIPLTVKLKITEGIVTSSVIILHLYISQKIDFPLIINELGIIVIGIGTGLIMNLYMPSLENELKKSRGELESLFSKIFHELAIYLRKGDSAWDGKEITKVDQILQHGKNLAFRNVENHVLRYDDVYYHYFKMREKQFEVIERLIPIVSTFDGSVKQGEIIADFVEEIAEGVHPGNTAQLFLDKLSDLRILFRDMPLPKTREEFEIRAGLFNFINEMEQYLLIKKNFKQPTNT